MYRLIFPLLFSLSINVCAIAQAPTSPSKSKFNKSDLKIVVTNWANQAFALPEYFWNKYSDTLIQQVGVNEFDLMKKHGPGTYPKEMALLSEGNLQNPDSLYRKLSKLNLELVAQLRHFNEEGTYIGIYALLRVPYSLNKDWDAFVKWDTVYFIFPMHALKIVD